jgi:hypothetical protein
MADKLLQRQVFEKARVGVPSAETERRIATIQTYICESISFISAKFEVFYVFYV